MNDPSNSGGSAKCFGSSYDHADFCSFSKERGLSLVIAGAIDIHYMDSLRILGNVINIVKPKLRKGSIGSWMKRTPQDSAVCTQTHLVCFENPGDLWDEGVVWVGVAEERADWEQHLRYGQRRWPLRPQYVEADRTVWVDVRVVYARRERHLRRRRRYLL